MLLSRYQEAEKHDEAVRDLEKVQRLEPSRQNQSSLQVWSVCVWGGGGGGCAPIRRASGCRS